MIKERMKERKKERKKERTIWHIKKGLTLRNQCRVEAEQTLSKDWN